VNAAQVQIVQIIQSAAQGVGLDPQIAVQVAQTESGLNQAAIGRDGEIGVFQLMPATAADLSVNPYNLMENIQGGVRYLKTLLDRFGNLPQALAAYNAGAGRVGQAIASGADWFSGIPATTRSYVNSILSAIGFGTVAAVSSPSSSPAAVTSGNYVLLDQGTPQAIETDYTPWLLAGAGAVAIYLLL
jgi:soluble lytic murein transglycosylase-like protein